MHQLIFEYCKPELLTEDYFHSVFEAIKSIADRIRNMTGLYADGAELIDTVFSTKNPLIRINDLQNDTDRSEHLTFDNALIWLAYLNNNKVDLLFLDINIDELTGIELLQS